MSDDNTTQHEQLLSSYLDGELNSAERALAESLIRDNPSDAALVQQWRDNASAINQLPRHRLDDRFADRVMAAIQTSQPCEPATLAAASANHISDTPIPTSTDWRVGLSAIATLAALLLMTVFLLPAAETESNNSTIAKNVTPKGGNPETSNHEPTDAQATPSPLRVDPDFNLARNSRLTGQHNNRPVTPLELNPSLSRRAGVEQVFWIDQISMPLIKQTLLNNSIKVIQPEDSEMADAATLPTQAGVEAIYVQSTAAKMKRLVGDLTHHPNCVVQAFPMPLGLSESNQKALKTSSETPSAQHINPLSLAANHADADEIASLDQWFGLVAEDHETRPVRILLLINATPSK